MNPTFPKIFTQFGLAAFILASVSAVAPNALWAHEPALRIGVRTTVETTPEKMGDRKTFSIFPPVEVVSNYKLVRPIAPETVQAVSLLVEEKLQTQGFVAVSGMDKPAMLITVQYGRGFLPNPYRRDMNRLNPEGNATTTVVGLPDFRRLEPGRESKAQFADEEKLFFAISAWDFASMQKGAKPLRLWSTTIVVDDPSHRDLGALYQQMIAAGAPYFNRRLDREEVEIPADAPEGRVEVGDPKVVPETRPTK